MKEIKNASKNWKKGDEWIDFIYFPCIIDDILYIHSKIDKLQNNLIKKQKNRGFLKRAFTFSESEDEKLLTCENFWFFSNNLCVFFLGKHGQKSLNWIIYLKKFSQNLNKITCYGRVKTLLCGSNRLYVYNLL